LSIFDLVFLCALAKSAAFSCAAALLTFIFDNKKNNRLSLPNLSGYFLIKRIWEAAVAGVFLFAFILYYTRGFVKAFFIHCHL